VFCLNTVNADETLLAGTYIEGDGRDYNNNRPAVQPAQTAQPAIGRCGIAWSAMGAPGIVLSSMTLIEARGPSTP